MKKLKTKKDLRKLKPGDVVYDADGDYMIKGYDGHMHQLAEQTEKSPCYLPAQRIKPKKLKF